MTGTRVRPSAGPSTSLVPGIHVFAAWQHLNVEGLAKPGHDAFGWVPASAGTNGTQVVRRNYFAASPFWQAAQTFAGVAGMSMWSAAPLGIALEIAFITAAIAAVVPASPVPFTPNGLLVAGTECTASRNSTGIWWARGMP